MVQEDRLAETDPENPGEEAFDYLGLSACVLVLVAGIVLAVVFGPDVLHYRAH